MPVDEPTGQRFLAVPIVARSVDDGEQMRELLVDDFELVEVSTQPEMAAYAKPFKAMEDAPDHPARAGAQHALSVREAMEKTRAEFVDAGATTQTLTRAGSVGQGGAIAFGVGRPPGRCRRAAPRRRSRAGRQGSAGGARAAGGRHDPFSSKLVVQAFDTQAWRAVVASRAADAIAQLRLAHPGVILVTTCPDVDGVALTEQVKANPAPADIPVPMLTADSRRDILARSVKAGAAGLIVESFTGAGLIAKLAPYLA